MAEPGHNALQADYRLHWYIIKGILGQGGFGITYLGFDPNLNQDVAIKEYLPATFASRAADSTVVPLSDTLREQFDWGLTRFISEGQTLAKFDHPSIVRVASVFEANNTAYMVMRYEQGEALSTILNREKTLDEDTLTKMLFAILDGLEQVHATGFIHRDIKPANIYIRKDGSPVLLDFGSARQALSAHTQTLTTMVSPGYAPFEQYYSSSSQQGPWTDIYALGATLYRAATGVAPMAAVDRSKTILNNAGDFMPPVTDLVDDRFSSTFLEAIDHALAFREQERPQSIADWRRDFDRNRTSNAAAVEQTAVQTPEVATSVLAKTLVLAPTEDEPETEVYRATEATAPRQDDQPTRKPYLRAAIAACIVVVIAVVALLNIAPESTSAKLTIVEQLARAREAYRAKDYQTAADLFHPIAASGNGEAQYQIGVRYTVGHGVEQSYQNAIKWFEEAQRQGLPNAAYNLGVLLESGKPSTPDLDRAVSLYQQAAAAGIRQADERLRRLGHQRGTSN